jgi:tRNA1Val (adenine37-N6)-methyltransferase
MVHRPRRLVDIFELCRKYRLEPKRMRTVHSYAQSPANMVLIEAVKEGGTQLIVEKPLVIYKSEGVYSEELIGNYGK